MQEFEINIRSFQQVQDFVRLACSQTFDIRVGNDRQNINGKDLMGMFSLDFAHPLMVRTQEDCPLFRQEALQLLAE